MALIAGLLLMIGAILVGTFISIPWGVVMITSGFIIALLAIWRDARG